jgi:hypothetical protein
MGSTCADGTPCVRADAQRGHCRGCMGSLRRSRTFLSDGTRDDLKDARPKLTECSEYSWESRPPRRTGEPCPGGSGTGGWRARSCEGREMRNAGAARTLVRGYSAKATGELIDTETVTVSSEEGRWKRAERHLAGGLPYPACATPYWATIAAVGQSGVSLTDRCALLERGQDEIRIIERG